MAIQTLTPIPKTLQQPAIYADSSSTIYALGAVQTSSFQVDESQGNNLFKYNVISDSWTQLATEPRYTGDSVNGTQPPGPIQVMGFAIDSIRSGASNLLYRVGGQAENAVNGGNNDSVNTMESYNPNTDTWTRLTDLPINIFNSGQASKGYEFPACAIDSLGNLWIGGGSQGGHDATTLFVWNGSTLTQKATLPGLGFIGFGGSPALIDANDILYFCGINGLDTNLNILKIYNPSTNSWTTSTAPQNIQTVNAQSTIDKVNGILYCQDNSGTSLQIYNISSGVWTTSSSRGGGSFGPVIFYPPDGNIYTFGGHIFQYNPSTDTWTNTGDSLSVFRNVTNIVYDSFNQDIYIPPGEDGSGNAINVFERFNPTGLTPFVKQPNYVAMY